MATSLQFNHRGLFVLVATSAGFLFIAALGPGLWGAELLPGISWQHRLFDLLCHQDPARSYTLHNTAMAVCSRCIGIYGSFVLFWLLMPLIAYTTKLQSRTLLWLFGSAIVLNLTDVLGNFFHVWTNMNGSRLLLGIYFGATTALLLMNDFFNQQSEVEDG